MRSPQAKRAQIERTRLRVEPLEVRALLSTMVLESEPNNTKQTADEVTFDAADGRADVIGSIGLRDDQDFFHFKATTAGAVNLVSETGGGFNTKITVEDGLGVKLLETEPNNGINSGSFSIQPGQDLFIRVRGNRSATGEYTVHLTLSESRTAIASRNDTRAEGSLRSSVDDHGGLDNGSTVMLDDHHHRHHHRRHGRGPDDAVPTSALAALVLGNSANAINEAEPNDRKEQANAFSLSADGQAQLQGVSDGERDKDFFRFTPSASGTLDVAINATAGPVAKLQIEDQFGNKKLETEPDNGINRGRFEVVSGRIYFIRLRAQNSAAANYLVDLALL